MRNQKHVNKTYSKQFKKDWRNKIKIANPYVQIKEELIEILFDFWSVWDGHRKETNFAKTSSQSVPGKRVGNLFCAVQVWFENMRV